MQAFITARQRHLSWETKQFLRQIDAAIRRHKAGTYGVCVGCGGPIPPPRLKALPFARACAQCQEEREQQGGRSTG